MVKANSYFVKNGAILFVQIWNGSDPSKTEQNCGHLVFYHSKMDFQKHSVIKFVPYSSSGISSPSYNCISPSLQNQT